MAAAFDVRGLNPLLDALSQADRESLLDAAAQGMQEGLEAIAREARAICPRDTGALAASIGIRLNRADGQLSGEVFASASHAVPVEMGTQTQPARPFLYPAFKAGEQQIVQAVAKTILEWM